MARGGGGFDAGSIIKWALLAGGGYYLYRTFTAAPASEAPPEVVGRAAPGFPWLIWWQRCGLRLPALRAHREPVAVAARLAAAVAPQRKPSNNN